MQGQDFAQRAAPQGAEAVQSAASNAQGVAQGVAQRTEETVEYAAPSRPIGLPQCPCLQFPQDLFISKDPGLQPPLMSITIKV